MGAALCGNCFKGHNEPELITPDAVSINIEQKTLKIHN